MISPEFFQGFFDADGSIQIVLRRRFNQKSLNCYILFNITQSKTNEDILIELQKQYGGSLTQKQRLTGTKECVLKYYITSASGQKIKAILSTHLPLNPNRRQDFFIACQIKNLLDTKQNQTKVGQIYMIHLIYQMSNQQNQLSTTIKRKPIEYWIHWVSPTEEEKKKGENLANSFFNQKIQSRIQRFLEKLPMTHLSNQYILGAHCGDGSLMVTFNWNPTKQYFNRPVWAITSNCQPYVKAFLYTMQKGRIKRVGPVKNQCFQFVIENVNPCIEKVFPLFENGWLPFYKRQQLKKFKKACCMLKCNYLNTEQDFCDFLNTVYDMSTNSKRKYSKSILQKWIPVQLKRKRFLKKKEFLYKQLMGSDF
jgi:hypothetical protein